MLSESDKVFLEAYLDDALSPTQVERLDSRLSDEPELTAAFDHLRTERAARIAAFNSLAPSTTDAARFAEAFLATLRHREWKRNLGRQVRIAAGVAACLIVGFSVGWFGRGRGIGSQIGIAPSMTITSPTALPIGSHADTRLVIHSPKPPEPGQYQVAVLDADGNVIALQHFARLEDARQFSDDLKQFEVRRQQVQESQPMLVSDSF
jgi:hypothetical protein